MNTNSNMMPATGLAAAAAVGIPLATCAPAAAAPIDTVLMPLGQ